MQGIYVALGSNLGDRRTNLQRAVELMAPQATVEAISPIYESAPQRPAAPPAYYNAVCRVTTELSPEALLAHLKDIEKRMGRRYRPHEHWGPRVIDLDLIMYNDEMLDTPTLTLPHPRMRERPFVLVPLRDLGYEVGIEHSATEELRRV